MTGGFGGVNQLALRWLALCKLAFHLVILASTLLKVVEAYSPRKPHLLPQRTQKLQTQTIISSCVTTKRSGETNRKEGNN